MKKFKKKDIENFLVINGITRDKIYVTFLYSYLSAPSSPLIYN